MDTNIKQLLKNEKNKFNSDVEDERSKRQSWDSFADLTEKSERPRKALVF